MDETAVSPEDARFCADYSVTSLYDRFRLGDVPPDRRTPLTEEAAERANNINLQDRRSHEILKRTWERLSGHLYLSAFPVFVIDDEGTLYEVSATFWGSRQGRRSFTEIMAHRSCLWVPHGPDRAVYGTPVARLEQLTGFLAGKPSEGPSARSTTSEGAIRTILIGGSPSSSISEPPQAGGRPSKYDWEAFLLEACRIVLDDGPPKTQAELIRRTLDWYQENIKGPAPDPEQCKPKIRQLWMHLRLRHNR